MFVLFNYNMTLQVKKTSSRLVAQVNEKELMNWKMLWSVYLQFILP